MTTPERRARPNRYLSSRLKRRAPGLQIVAALWHHGFAPEATPGPEELGVDGVACRLAEACDRLTALPDGRAAAYTPPLPVLQLASASA